MEIDFVIAWVDGNDENWKKEREKYSNKGDATTDSRDIRYRDFDNLQYWFRGVEKFAPWVRKIHFITYGHIPKWLNLDNPKINIVRHEEYIPEKYLPTFSSHPIELNMHRIEGLSENFVYFNDDMFLISETSEKDFFKDGLPCDTAVINAHPSIKGSLHISETNMEIINDNFKKNTVLKENFFKWINIKYGIKLFRTFFLLPWPDFIGIWDHHLATSFKKSTFDKLWNLEYATLDFTSSNKFRYAMDVNQWLFRYWQIVSGEFKPRKSNFGKSFVLNSDEKNNSKIFNSIIKQKYKMICINDSIDIKNFDKVKNELNCVFESLLPKKSSFEI